MTDVSNQKTINNQSSKTTNTSKVIHNSIVEFSKNNRSFVIKFSKVNFKQLLKNNQSSKIKKIYIDVKFEINNDFIYNFTKERRRLYILVNCEKKNLLYST